MDQMIRNPHLTPSLQIQQSGQAESIVFFCAASNLEKKNVPVGQEEEEEEDGVGWQQASGAEYAGCHIRSPAIRSSQILARMKVCALLFRRSLHAAALIPRFFSSDCRL